MNKNSLFKKIVSGILALVMVFGTFTALNGAFSGVKAETVNLDGSITYSASNSAIVLNKDAWLEPDGTYAIDLTAFITGEKQINAEQFDTPTDFIVVVDQSCTMRDYWSTGCIDGYSYSATTYTLTAAKSITRALVDALRANGGDHRVGIIGFGGHSCDSGNSNTGLFDNNGNWYNYRFTFGYQWPTAAQNKYGSTLTRVNTEAGYTALKKAISGFTFNSGAYTDIGLEMAQGVINATKNDSYQVVNANGTVSNVARKKVVIILTDGTPGWDGFDMKIAAAAVNNATSIKKNFGAKIYTVAFSTLIEELLNAWNVYGKTVFATSYGWNNDSAPVHTNAYDPAYGTANGVFTTTKYNTLKLQGEFFSRDFTTVLSSVYPCTEGYGANGPIQGKYLTNSEAYSYVGQYCSNIQSTNTFPVYNVNGYYANTYVTRAKSIGYFYTEANGRHRLISGLYDNNVGNFSNRIPYNNHPVDKANDPEYGRYRISVPDARILVNGTNSNPNYAVPTRALSALIENFIAEIPTGTNYSGSTEMNTIGDAYIKDIISEYFKYHDSFDPEVNVKTFTQDAIDYRNGEYVFANNIVRYNDAIVNQYDDVVTVGGFDYDANTCYRDANGVHGKKFIVQIRGLLAKEDTVGHVAVSNTAEQLSGLYAGTPSADDNGGSNAPVEVNNFAPITGIELENIYVIYDGKYYYPKQPVLNVTPVNSDYTVTWSVGSTAVATVDENGTVRGENPNYTTTLTAKVYDKVSGRTFTDSSTIAVVRPTSCSKVSYYEIVPMTLKVGSDKIATLDVSPINSNYSIKNWISSNSNVARVDSATGKVTGVSEGTATLTAQVYDWVQGKYLANKSITVTVLPETTVIDDGSNGGNNGGGNTPDQLLVMGGDEVIFPIPSVNLREKHIVYDFSLVIKDERAEEFFAETRANGVSSHDVAHVLTLDDPYAKQTANGSGYNYHVQYPYDNTKHADLFEHFAVNISENGAGNSHPEVVIKSINGEQYDLAAMLQLTDHVVNDSGYAMDNRRTDIVTGEKFTKYEWSRISFLPATNVHYEESLLTFNNATTSSRDVVAKWTEIGHANGATYDVTAGSLLTNVKHGDAQQSATYNVSTDNYGHDAEYHNGFVAGKTRITHHDSNNRAMTVKVDRDLMTLVNAGQAEWPTAEFTFTGTGLDLVSRTGADTGALTLDVVPVGEEWSYTVTGRSLHVTIDTYYGDGLLYQIPVHHAEGLVWGEYKARVTARYMPKFDHQTKDYTPVRGNTEMNEPGLEPGVVYTIVNACDNEGTAAAASVTNTRGKGTFNCVIDSIRVYNPHAEQVTKDHIYAQHNEENPDYFQVRDRLINAASFGGAADRVSGIVYIDGSNGDEVTIEDYIIYGPKNEAYLKPGNGFAFTVKEFDKNSSRLHISAKCPNGKRVAMLVNGHKIEVKGSVINIDSATEMFFDVTDYIPANGRVAITCAVTDGDSDAILSVGSIKLISDAQPTRGGDNDSFYVDQGLIDFAAKIITGRSIDRGIRSDNSKKICS